MTARYNFVGSEACYQNATFQVNLVWNNAEGTPYDLARYSAYMQVRQFPSNTVALIDINTDNARIKVDGLGNIVILVPKEETSTLIAGKYTYDLVMVSLDGTATRLLEGDFEIRAGVTRNIPVTIQ